jgi:very-short-patch-repair endonuclease
VPKLQERILRTKCQRKMLLHKAHCQHKVEMMTCTNCNKKFKGKAGLKAHQIWCLDDSENYRKRQIIKAAIKKGNIRRLLSGNANQSSNTDIEILFLKELKKSNIKYKHSYLFQTDKHTHVFDFFLPNYKLLIETDGDYWHGNKGPLKDWQLRQIEIDKTYTKAAINEGFRVIRFWGSTIKKNCTECVEEAIHYAKTNQSRVEGHSRDIRSWS